MYNVLFGCLLMGLLLVNNAIAEDQSGGGTVAIEFLLEGFAKNSGLRVISGPEVAGDIALQGFDVEQIDYATLLKILKHNGYTAFVTGKYVEVVPEHRARLHASELLEAGKDYPDDQYLTDIVKVENLCVAS